MLSEEQRRAYRLQDAESERNLMPPELPPEQRLDWQQLHAEALDMVREWRERTEDLEAELRRLQEAAEVVTRAWYEWSPVSDSAEFAAFGIDMEALDLALSQSPPNKGVPMTELAEQPTDLAIRLPSEAEIAHNKCMARYPVEERVSFEECSNPKCVEAREEEEEEAA